MTLSAQDCDVLADDLAPLIGRLSARSRAVLGPVFEMSARVQAVRAISSARNLPGRIDAEPARGWMTTGEAALSLGVSDRYVRRLCRESPMPIARGPAGRRIPSEQVERWRADGVGKKGKR